MEFKEGFNPGQNNTYTEVNMGDHSIYVPGVAHLTIVNGGKAEGTAIEQSEEGVSPARMTVEPDANKDLTATKTAILNYTSRLTSYLNPQWMQCWERFWKGILDVDVIENEICKIGKQRGTSFNRAFICTIVNYLNGDKDFFKEKYTATDFARFLEGNEMHSIRSSALPYKPDDGICKRIDRYIEDFEL